MKEVGSQPWYRLTPDQVRDLPCATLKGEEVLVRPHLNEKTGELYWEYWFNAHEEWHPCELDRLDGVQYEEYALLVETMRGAEAETGDNF